MHQLIAAGAARRLELEQRLRYLASSSFFFFPNWWKKSSPADESVAFEPYTETYRASSTSEILGIFFHPRSSCNNNKSFGDGHGPPVVVTLADSTQLSCNHLIITWSAGFLKVALGCSKIGPILNHGTISSGPPGRHVPSGAALGVDLGAGAVHRLRARHQDLARLRVTLLERRVQGLPIRVDRPGRVRRPSFFFQRLSLLRQQTNPTDQSSETTDRAVARTYLV